MGLFINTNTASVNARSNLDAVTTRLEGNFRRLSTGLRIVTASDDAAGLAISERMRARVRSLGQAQRNANDGISLVRVAEGAMDELNSILIRLRELAIQANNGTVSAADRDTLDQEFDNLIGELDRIAASTDFNGAQLLSGTTGSISFHVGSGATTGVDTISVALPTISASDLGLGTVDISSAPSASPTGAITAIDGAIDLVAQARGDLGAVNNRLNSTIRSLSTSIENLGAAESRIRDVDVALESAELTRNTILQQAAITILAQANTQPQVALQLLG